MPITRSSERVDRREEYRGLKHGQKIRVKDGTYKGCTVEFLCHAVSKRSGAEWVEVHGGLRGQAWVIALPVEYV